MKQHSIYCSAFRHFFKNLENMLRLRQVQFIHRSVSPYKISRISCVNIFTMGKRTLAIKHTLEKNLFYKLFNWLRNKTSISLLLAANRKRTTLVTIHLLKERWHNQPFKSWRGWKFFSFYVYKSNVWQKIAKKDIFTTRHLAQSYDSCDLSRRVQVASKFKEKRYKKCGLTFTI